MSDQPETGSVRKGKCLCGAVTVTCEGDPAIKAICHCRDCRAWTGSLQMATMWLQEKVSIEGEDDLIEYKSDITTPGLAPDGGLSNRYSCRKCGSCIINKHPMLGKVDVPAGLVYTSPEDPFKPEMHIWYSQRVLNIVDGLPKFKDLPAGFKGTDEQVPEE
ncbi:unnamed protein product [Amoebophrya sp. A25]|nr:unnamed protein product [Amoebophrya sp. A25]|eukprot:GSA25T00025858001.1